jgi:glucose-6-phosphate 1-dehydrogenase
MKRQALVVFGATGNLMYKKLLPALDSLFEQGQLTEELLIYAVGRRPYTTEEYLQEAQDSVQESVQWDRIKQHLTYVKLDVDQVEDYVHLRDEIGLLEQTDIMVYLAVPPSLFPIIAGHISNSGLIQKGDTNRIVFEKPFGEDLASATKINQDLWQYFDESQIYRIDHYLGKDMIQNILVVRFANRIFEHTWNANMIRSVVIVAKEQESVMQRGGYYDTIGAIKDMLQSHLLQMASLIAMTKPKSFASEDIKNAKIHVFEHMSIDPDSIVRGQYNGYRNAKKVDPSSHTETFVFCKAEIDLDKWKGVPFYFVTGKKLDEKRSEIIINFRDDDSLLVLNKAAKPHQNRLVIKVSPEDGVEFRFNVKHPGLENRITTASLDYCHSCLSLQNTPEAYEKLLLDLTQQQRTLFTRWDEIEATWRIISHMKHDCKDLMIYDTMEDIKAHILSTKGVNLDDL